MKIARDLDIKSRVLAYLTKRVGNVTPRGAQVAQDIGCTSDEYHAACTWLKRNGKIAVEGVGYSRVVHVIGVGKTVAVSNKRAERDAFVPPPKFEPVRAGNYSCPRCGVRNCTRHSASILTTGHVPAWRVGA